MSQHMSQDEFARYTKAKQRHFLAIHWPRAKELLGEGKDPKEVARQMASEGYQGFASSCFCLRDLHFLERLSFQQSTEAEPDR